MVKVLIISDGGWNDLVTDFSRYNTKKRIVEYAVSLGFEVIELDGDQARQIQFLAAMRSGVRFVAGTGHGNKDVYTGYMEEILLSSQLWGETAGKTMDIVSCEYGQRIDERLAAGEKYENSYTDLVYINVDSSTSKPETDKTSIPYFECLYEFARQYLDGKTRGDASLAQDALFERTKGQVPIYDQYYINWDQKCRGSNGEPNGTIREEQSTESYVAVSLDGVPTRGIIVTGPGTYDDTLGPPTPGKHLIQFQRYEAGEPTDYAERHIFVQADGTGMTVTKPDEGQIFPPGDRVPIQIVIA